MSVQNRLNDDIISAALFAHRGENAVLNSWTAESFTEKADNYSSIILNIKVQYQQLGYKQRASYIAKLSPECEDDSTMAVSYVEFTNESGFYQRILPDLSCLLKECGIEEIRTPCCFFSSVEKVNSLIILEDLREKGYRLHDRERCLDVTHTKLVLQELAKLHASSYVLQQKDPSIDLREKYPDLLRIERKIYIANLGVIISTNVENALRVIRKYGGYERAEKWLEDNKTNCLDIIYKQLTGVSTFDVVCQGDCWNNNILFRYDENNDPIEVMLLDFQQLWKASLATELIELLYTTLDGHTRKTHMDSFLATYHETFQRVLEASGTPMAFSLQELHGELKNKMVNGLVLGLVTVPSMVSGDEGLQWYEGPPDDEELHEVFKNELERKTCQKLDSSSSLKQRFFSIFDDMIEAGVM